MSGSADSRTWSHNGDPYDQYTPFPNASQASSESREGGAGVKKRRRVAVACRGCSSRKTRCDGGRPKCSSCQEMEVECIYLQPVQQTAKRQTNALDVELLNRLQAVEERLKLIQEASPGPLPQTPSRRDSETRILPENHPYDFHASNAAGSHLQDGQVSSVGTEDDAVDGMGAIVLTDDKEENGFFAASSNITLFKRITQAVAQTVSSTTLNLNDFQGMQHLARPKTSIPSPAVSNRPGMRGDGFRVNLYAVPAVSKAMPLIQLFFATVGMMLPCIYEDPFMKSYRQAVETGFSGVRRPWLAILNMMFAFSTTVASPLSPLQNLADESDTYYQRALGLATQDVLDCSSLENVQLSLLFSTYLMGTQKSMKTWNFHALAVNGALNLGLHSPQASNALPPLEQELRKRVWFWCVTNDRFLSMLFGRAPMIHESLAKMDLPVNVENSRPSSVSPKLMESIIDQFCAYIELHKLMGHTVDKLYNQNWRADLPMTTHEILAHKLDLSWKLAEWQQNLPSAIRIIASSELQQGDNLPALEPLRLRIFLTLRYLNVQTLILRPIMLKFLDYKPNTDDGEHELALLKGPGLCALQECSAACIEDIKLMGRILNPCKPYQTTTLHGAWWFNTYYVFNSSLVLFGILLVCKKCSFQGLFAASAILEMRESLGQAVDILQALDNGNAVIARCRECLLRLVQIYDSMDLPNTTTPPVSHNTPLAFTGNMQQVGAQDMNLFPLMQGIGASGGDMDMAFGDLGGLVMNSDYEFINNWHHIVR